MRRWIDWLMLIALLLLLGLVFLLNSERGVLSGQLRLAARAEDSLTARIEKLVDSAKTVDDIQLRIDRVLATAINTIRQEEIVEEARRKTAMREFTATLSAEQRRTFDSITTSYNRSIASRDSIIKVTNSRLDLAISRLGIRDSIIADQTRLIVNLNLQRDILTKEVRKSKLEKWGERLLIGAAFVYAVKQ